MTFRFTHTKNLYVFGKQLANKWNFQPRRHLNLQEYQSKSILEKHNVTVQKFVVADKVEDAADLSRKLKAGEYVVKAQILAGGRGLGVFDSGFKGGVHLTKE